jgi:cytochrome c556
MNNIFSQIAAMTPGAAAAATPAEPNPQDISREELMKLCIKMQARMQQYEAKGKALFKKKTTIAAERQKLLDLLRMVMPVPTLTSDDDELNLDTIEQSWADFEVRRRDQLATLEAKVVEKEQLMQQSLKSMEEHYKRIIADLKVNSPIPKEGSAEGANEAPQEDKNASIAAIIEAEQEKLVSSMISMIRLLSIIRMMWSFG